jgi:8-oxo-dGTP diphosphatase
MIKRYRYCPFCKGRLDYKSTRGLKLKHCTKCDRIFYDNPATGVAILVEKDRKILFVKRNVMPKKNRWALPGGFIEQGETIEKAALRELKEECNMEGRNVKILSIFAEQTAIFGTVIAVGVFMTSAAGNVRAGDDAKEAKFFSIDKMPKIAFKSHRFFVDKYIKDKL